jgi:hypothetical protein
LGLHTHFVTGIPLRLALSHILTQHSTSIPLPEPERYGFTHKKGVTQVSLGVDQTPLLPPEAGLNSNPGSYQSDEWGSQVGSWDFLGSFVQLEHTTSAGWERGSLPLRSTQSSGSWQRAWDVEPVTGGENTTLWILGKHPRNIAGGFRQRQKAPKLLGSKFIKPAATHWTRVQRLSPEKKGAFLIYHLEQVTETGSIARPIHNHMLFHWLL